jgi:hypothetical protein
LLSVARLKCRPLARSDLYGDQRSGFVAGSPRRLFNPGRRCMECRRGALAIPLKATRDREAEYRHFG